MYFRGYGAEGVYLRWVCVLVCSVNNRQTVINFDGELSVIAKIMRLHAYIIVQLQLVFNRFFYFYIVFFDISTYERILL